MVKKERDNYSQEMKIELDDEEVELDFTGVDQLLETEDDDLFDFDDDEF